MSVSRYAQVMKEIADRTQPSDLSLRRCRDDIDTGRPVQKPTHSSWPEPNPRAIRRVRWKLSHGDAKRSSWRTPTALVVLAAALLLFVLFSPEQGSNEPPSSLPEMTLVASGPATLTPAPYLNLHYSGTGQMQREGDTWRLTWKKGSLMVDLDPDAMASVTVETEDALVEVLGTKFTVLRDTLGTRVTVQRGVVRTRCVRNEETVTLGAMSEHACWPTTPAGLLARAIHLADHGGSPQSQLATLHEGIVMSEPNDPVHGELLAHKFTAFLEADRHTDALEAARDYLDLPSGPRAPSIREVAVQLSLSLESCEKAKEWLDHSDLSSASATGIREQCP